MSKASCRVAWLLGATAAITLLLIGCAKGEETAPTAKVATSVATTAATRAPAGAPTSAATAGSAAPDITKVKWDSFPPVMQEMLKRNGTATFKRPDPYKPIYGGVLRRQTYATTGRGATLGANYIKVSNSGAWTMWGIISGNLVSPEFGWGADLSTGTGAPVPDLAESWTSSKDGTQWTFKLRDNVFWQDKAPVNGRKVTAADVKWFLDTVRTQGWLADDAKTVSSVEIPDERTVVINTSKPFPDLLDWLATPMMVMAPKECWDAGDKCITESPVGFGAYQLRELTLSRWALERNPKYHMKDRQGNQLPYMDGIEFIPVADPATRDANLRTGELDYETYRDQASWLNIKNSIPNLQLEFAGPAKTITLMGDWLAFNYKNAGPWQDKRVRQALSMAINRQRICDIAALGFCVVQSPINAERDLGRPFEFSIAEMSEVAPYYKYDPEQAKKLLADAGYPNGFSMEVITGTTAKGLGAVEQWLMVFDDWKKIGVNVNHKPDQNAATLLGGGGFSQAMGFGYNLSGSRMYQQAYSLLYSTGAANFIGLKDPTLDQMLDARVPMPTASKERQEQSRKIFDYINEQMYRPTLWVGMVWEATQPWVVNETCGSDSCANITMRTLNWTWLDPSAKGFPASRKFEPRSKP